jgi:hypothetical protein
MTLAIILLLILVLEGAALIQYASKMSEQLVELDWHLENFIKFEVHKAFGGLPREELERLAKNITNGNYSDMR